MFGYQIFIQTSVSWLEKIGISNISNLIYIFPPTWFAMPGYITRGNAEGFYMYLTALLGIAVSIFGYKYYLTKMAPSFEKNLYKLSLMETKIGKKRKSFALYFNRLFRSQPGKALYDFSVVMLSRERRTKHAVYPVLIMGIFFPFIFIFRLSNDPNVVVSETKSFYFMYYTILMILPLSIYVNYSENFKAAWLFRYLPIKTPGIIIKCSQLAMFFKYQIIILLFTSAIYLYLWKFSIIEHVVAIILNCLMLQLIYQNLAGKKLPFSEEMKTGQNTAFKQGSYILTAMVFGPLLAGFHYASTIFEYGISFYLILQVIAFYFLFRNHYLVDWKDL